MEFSNRDSKKSSDSPSRRPSALEVIHKDKRQEKKEIQEASSSSQLDFEALGLKRLHDVYNKMRLIDNIRECNQKSVIQFYKRYTNSMSRYKEYEQSWYLQTYVKGYKDQTAIVPCYTDKLSKYGKFIVIGAVRHQFDILKNNSEFDNIGWKIVSDDEIKLAETAPLHHSEIMYNHIILMQKKLKPYYGNIDITSLEDSHIINGGVKSMINLYLKKGETEKTFSRGEPGYIATVGTDLGIGKWYLIKHHYENKEIVAVTLQRGIDKDENGKDIYNILYHIENKSY